jgi:Ca-activated chloride channel homolog
LHFAFSWALILLVLPLILLGLSRSEQRKIQVRLARLGMFETLKPMLTFFSPKRRFLRRTLGTLSVLCLVLSLSGPQLGSQTEIRPRLGLDVIFAIDVSKSMRAQDVRPDRLARAQFEIASFLEQIGENRVAIVAFAGTSFVQCPLTTDIEAVKTFLQALSPELMPQGGTALADGIQTSLRLFDAQALAQGDNPNTTGRILVLVTDGEDHQGEIESAAQALKKGNVSTVVIGLGSALGEPIPIKNEAGQMAGYLKNKNGQTVMTRLNEPMLREIADKAQGKYIDGLTEPDLGLSYVESLVGQLEKQELQARVQTFYVDRFFWPLLLAFLFWLLGVGLSPGGRAYHMGLGLLMIGTLFNASDAFAQKPKEQNSFLMRPEPQIEAGINALQRQDFESALTYFANAPGTTRPHRAIKAYNRGFVLLQQGALLAQEQAAAAQPQGNGPTPTPAPAAPPENDPTSGLFTSAEQAFQNAYGLSSIPQIRSEAALGLGNSRLFQQDLEGAIEGYRDALVANPANERAKKNLLRALQMQKEQEQQKEQNPDENQDSEGEPKDQDKQDGEQEQKDGDQEQKEGQEEEKKKDKGDPDDQKKKDEEKKQEQQKAKPEEPQQQKSGVRLLDALREQEKPLAPFQMRMNAPKELPEKDW